MACGFAGSAWPRGISARSYSPVPPFSFRSHGEWPALYQGVWPLLVSVRPETPRIVCASFMLKRGSEPATVRSHPAMPIRTVTPTAKQCPMFHYRPDRTGRAGLKGGACRSLKGWAQARCGKARPRAAFAQLRRSRYGTLATHFVAPLFDRRYPFVFPPIDRLRPINWLTPEYTTPGKRHLRRPAPRFVAPRISGQTDHIRGRSLRGRRHIHGLRQRRTSSRRS